MLNLHLNNTIIQNLSENELTILKYIYAHSDEVTHMSIQELSKSVSFSSATILRFCKKIGLSGFSELKYIIRKDMENESQVPDLAKISNQMIKNSIITDIEGTSNLIKNDQFIEIVSLINSDLPLFLWTPGGITSVVVDYFEKLLFVCGRQNVYKYESARMCEHVVRSLKKKAIIFIISTSGTYEPSLRIARLAHIKSMYLISITPFNNNTISQLTPYHLHFFTDQRENEGADITSRIPIFYILSMLIGYYVKMKEGIDL